VLWTFEHESALFGHGQSHIVTAYWTKGKARREM
jgi:hypothetical protein